MKTIETTAAVTKDHKLVLEIEVPSDISPGEHQVIVVIKDKPPPGEQRQPLKLSAYPIGLVSDAFTFRREDLYDDNGR